MLCYVYTVGNQNRTRLVKRNGIMNRLSAVESARPLTMKRELTPRPTRSPFGSVPLPRLRSCFVSFCLISGRNYILVLNVEELSDFFWGFTLDHVGYGLASDVTISSAQLHAYEHQSAYRRGLMSR